MSDFGRRHFLKISTTGVLGLAAYQGRHLRAEDPACQDFHPRGIDERELSGHPNGPDVTSALVGRYPWLKYGGAQPDRRIRIANIGVVPAGAQSSEFLGERVFGFAGARFLPWSPMFDRPTTVSEAGKTLKALAGAERLFIKDEGSDLSALYGNKIRKYEFLLPSLALSGVKKIYSYGAFGSNHCSNLALAARYGRYRLDEETDAMESEFYLYPQEITAQVITKLRLLTASGARLRFLEGDAAVALSIARGELKTRYAGDDAEAYIPPGGSSPLSVLGHIEAIMELAEQIEGRTCPLAHFPDYIFVPLGSGATAIGLVLGCQLLGWPTRVVATCSQDKGTLARALVNGDIDTPFLVANAASLLDKALVWLRHMGFTMQSSREVLLRGFSYDNETWHPGYGKATPEIQQEASAAAGAGLVLDNTFTAKSFHTLKNYAKNGLLKNKTALFWNTYQRFPFEKLLTPDNNWTDALPESIKSRVNAFLSSRADLS